MNNRDLLGRVKHILFVNKYDALKLYLSLSSILWGALLFFSRDLDRAIFLLMQVLAPLTIWGIGFLVSGFFSLYILLVGSRNKVAQLTSPTLGFTLWTSSAACMVFSVSPIPAEIAPHLIATLAQWWIIIRTKV